MPDYPHHLATFDYVGFHRYSLTFCTYERQEHFDSATHVDLVLRQILRLRRSSRLPLLRTASCETISTILAGGAREDADLKAFVARAKQYSGFY